MLSDRSLAHLFGMRPGTIALWGDSIRGLTLLVATLVIVALTGVYGQTLRHTVTQRNLQDFGLFYDSAVRFRSGVDLYPPSPTADTRAPGNLNPPHFHVLLSPLTAWSRETAFAIWMVANGAALVVSLAVISRTLSLGGWAVASMAALIYASPGMFAMLMTGQVAGVLLLPYTLGWWQARRGHHVKASWWLGVCASVKPLFLLFAPAMALAGRWRAAAVLAATVLLVFAGGVAVYGLDSHRLWVNNLRAVTWAEHYMNASLLGLVERSLSATAWRYRPVVDAAWMVMPIWAIAAGGVTFATLWRVRMIADVDRQFLLLTTAALLVSPLSWVYYLWFLIPALTAHLASSPAHDRKCRTALVLGLACLLAPLPWVSAAETWRAGLGTPTFGSIYCWGLVALWTSAWREPTATDVTRPRTSIE